MKKFTLLSLVFIALLAIQSCDPAPPAVSPEKQAKIDSLKQDVKLQEEVVRKQKDSVAKAEKEFENLKKK